MHHLVFAFAECALLADPISTKTRACTVRGKERRHFPGAHVQQYANGKATHNVSSAGLNSMQGRAAKRLGRRSCSVCTYVLIC